MKIPPVLAVSLVSFGFAAAALAQDIKFTPPGDQPPAAGATPPSAEAATPPALASSPTAPTYTADQLCEEVGWAMAKQSGATDMGFSPAEVTAFIKGFGAAMSGNASPYDLKSIVPQMNSFMARKQAAYLQHLKQKNFADADAFFAKVKEHKDVVVLPSGLCYKILTPGEGPFPTGNEIVKVNYTGFLIDGSIFDSSLKHGQPAEFQLDQVIPGWTEGIQKINRGGKIRLFIPADLAYGDEGRPGIPPGAALIFDIELLDIKPGNPAASGQGSPITVPPVGGAAQ